MTNVRNVFFLVFFYSNISQSQTIEYLEIFYLPWSIRPEGHLEVEDVRDFNNGKNSYFCVQDSVAVNEFVISMSLLYLKPFPELKPIGNVMVIDAYFEDGTKKTIGLNYRKHVEFNNVRYYTNYKLVAWIDKYVPPAKKPW
jgi:hypothetical protein